MGAEIGTNRTNEFDLFLGSLGNGTICCNRAVMEHGDYQNICHISPEGKVSWYHNPESIPCEARQKIWQEAERSYKCFEEHLNTMPEILQYSYLLDRVPHKAFMHVVNMEKGKLKEKITYLKSVLEERTCFPKEVLSFCENAEKGAPWRIWFTRYDASGDACGSGVMPVSYWDAGKAHDAAREHFGDNKEYTWVVSQKNPYALSSK